jgi:hypothetical protein
VSVLSVERWSTGAGEARSSFQTPDKKC